MSRAAYVILVLIISGLAALNPVAIDAFLPAMPDIARDLAVKPGTIGVTIGVYAFGTAIGQICFGPFSDRFGRKPLLLIGLSIFVFSAFGSSYATSIELLMVWRFLQGIGAASGRILAMAIVRDNYEKEQAAKLLSYMMAIAGVLPMFGPAIGSVLLSFFDWSAVFIYMAMFGLLLLAVVVLFFKESLTQKNHRAIHPVEMLVNSRLVLTNKSFLAYTCCLSMSGAGLYAFLAASPEILINML